MTTVGVMNIISFFFLTFRIVLTSDYAVLLAEEFGRNPVVDDEAAFDIHPPYVALSS